MASYHKLNSTKQVLKVISFKKKNSFKSNTNQIKFPKRQNTVD